MRTVVITPPPPIIGWELLDQHLRLGGDTSQQPYVMSLAAAAQANIDGPGGWLGRAIGQQTLEARFSSFACTDLTLPYPDAISITSVVYIDSDGSEQTMSDDDYELAGQLLSPIWGTRWPRPRAQAEAVRVRYQAGYATVPEPIKAAILIMTGDLYAGRESFAVGQVVGALPSSTTVTNLLSPYRVFV